MTNGRSSGTQSSLPRSYLLVTSQQRTIPVKTTWRWVVTARCVGSEVRARAHSCQFFQPDVYATHALNRTHYYKHCIISMYSLMIIDISLHMSMTNGRSAGTQSSLPRSYLLVTSQRHTIPAKTTGVGIVTARCVGSEVRARAHSCQFFQPDV